MITEWHGWPAGQSAARPAPSDFYLLLTATEYPVTTFGILGLIIMYLAANVALTVEWVKFRRHGIHKSWWLWLVTPAVGVVVLAIPIWGDLRPGQPSPFNALPWLTLCPIAVGVVYALVLSITRPAVLERAPALLEGEESLEVDPMPAA